MLIDARHKEETRVAVVSGNRIEELDFESSEHKQIKGNIYLAKVTRVEPSLQAAFVDYGGNRQGFLAFSEIHPDYYQIPKEDREQLLAEEAAAAAEEAELREKEEAEDELAALEDISSYDSDENHQEDTDEIIDSTEEEINGKETKSKKASNKKTRDKKIATKKTEGEAEAPKVKRTRTRRKKAASDENEVIQKKEDTIQSDEEENIASQSPDNDEPIEKPKKQRKRRTAKTKSMVVDDSEDIIVDEENFAFDDDNIDEISTEDESDSSKSDEDKPRNRRRRGNRGRNDKKNNRTSRLQRARRPSDEVRAKRIALRRRYKIQDVIHRRQVLLVQVVKEERGNKGAALTSYLSLAGRYCVLMPNTSHGGGISRKISNGIDRKRLKSIVADMNLPVSMGCIIRTAGLSKTKVEIKRDFDYLARLWDKIRERTLTGSAPMLVHSDSDLIKRAIRDIYNRDISEVNIEGKDGYKAARDFMKLLTPSHVKRLKQYTDSVPLFQRYGVEDQLNAMYHPIVQLKSGGYIVINPTEALVSIDINSGRSTKEHGIEATAVNTNLEAAREIARQLRLRDMAGLIVIDFIDMDHHSNIRKVERAMKDALRNDRARIQVGRISSFGLMEMSRQRLRTGVLEASTRECPHCEGSGLVRTSSSSALSALRMIEDEAARGKGSIIELAASEEAAIYVLNNKRAELADIEERYTVSISIRPNGEVEGAKMTVSSSGPKPMKTAHIIPITDDNISDNSVETIDEITDEGNNRRRRGRRGGRGRHNIVQTQSEKQEPVEDNAENEVIEPVSDKHSSSVSEKPKRRSSRSKKTADALNSTDNDSSDVSISNSAEAKNNTIEKPKRKRTPRKKNHVPETTASEESAKDEIVEKPSDENNVAAKTKRKTSTQKTSSKEPISVNDNKLETVKKPRKRSKKAEVSDTANEHPKTTKSLIAKDKPETEQNKTMSEVEKKTPKDNMKTRKGWWQRTFG